MYFIPSVHPYYHLNRPLQQPPSPPAGVFPSTILHKPRPRQLFHRSNSYYFRKMQKVVLFWLLRQLFVGSYLQDMTAIILAKCMITWPQHTLNQLQISLSNPNFPIISNSSNYFQFFLRSEQNLPNLTFHLSLSTYFIHSLISPFTGIILFRCWHLMTSSPNITLETSVVAQRRRKTLLS